MSPTPLLMLAEKSQVLNLGRIEFSMISFVAAPVKAAPRLWPTSIRTFCSLAATISSEPFR
jgi:hypothetical protein